MDLHWFDLVGPIGSYAVGFLDDRRTAFEHGCSRHDHERDCLVVVTE